MERAAGLLDPTQYRGIVVRCGLFSNDLFWRLF